MESAVYLAATNKIYGVRGQWIYECDPTTGAVVRAGRFCDNCIFGSNITAIGTKLYVGMIYQDRWNYNTSLQGLDIFSIDPTVLPFPTATAFGFDSKLVFNAPPFLVISGWSSLTTDGVNIYGYSPYEGMFRVDPNNLASFITTSSLDADGIALDTAAHAGFTSPFPWNTTGRIGGGPGIVIRNGDFTDSNSDNGGVGPALGGITVCNSTGKVYAVKGTEDFHVVNANEPFVGGPPFLGTFNVGVLHTAPIPGVINPQPARIRACNVIGHPYFGKVLIPTMKGDSVIVWDSASDNPALAVCKTGFSAPYDIVFTPTKTFAVQNSSAGLKEVV